MVTSSRLRDIAGETGANAVYHDLSEGQYELDGFVFGKDTEMPVLESGFDPGSAEVTDQDVLRPQGDGSLVGRDYLDGPEKSLTIGVLDGTDARSHAALLARAWRADHVRMTPGAHSVLRYRRAGVTYRCLGRARKFGLSVEQVTYHYFEQAVATFKLSQPEMYVEDTLEQGGGLNDPDQRQNRLVLKLIPVPTGGGLRLPARLPWRLAPGSGAMSGTVEVTSLSAAPFQVEVHGPISGRLSGFTLTGPDWTIQSSASVAYDQVVRIDTATHTVTRGTGQSLAGTLSWDSDLSARLEPGRQTLTFDGDDPSNTAYAVITWRDTVPA